MKGLGTGSGLPGVRTDALRMDPKAHKTNRELAKRISDAVVALKSDEDGQQFILGWRLYPNKEHPRWQQTDSRSNVRPSASQQEVHVCGCGCGCSSMGGEPKPNP